MKPAFGLSAIKLCRASFLMLIVLACGTPASIEDIGSGWVRLNGAPNGNNPYMEIGCVTGADVPTLTTYAGSDKAKSTGAWHVTIGDWSTSEVWEWNDAPGYKGGAIRTPGRPLEFEIFRQIATSEASSFTLEMDRVYTFSLAGDIRDQLANKFPQNCYTEQR